MEQDTNVLTRLQTTRRPCQELGDGQRAMSWAPQAGTTRLRARQAQRPLHRMGNSEGLVRADGLPTLSVWWRQNSGTRSSSP